QYHFEGFNLIGQSGGAHLVAGLLGMRQDIGCAVIGSGPLAPVKRPRAANDLGAETYNPLNNIDQIAQNRAARIMVVTDPADRKVNGEKQTEFVKRLQQAGKQVEHYLVQATDENRHGVVIYSRVALAGCLRNDSTDVVAQQIQKMVDRRVAATNREP